MSLIIFWNPETYMSSPQLYGGKPGEIVGVCHSLNVRKLTEFCRVTPLRQQPFGATRLRICISGRRTVVGRSRRGVDTAGAAGVSSIFSASNRDTHEAPSRPDCCSYGNVSVRPKGCMDFRTH